MKLEKIHFDVKDAYFSNHKTFVGTVDFGNKSRLIRVFIIYAGGPETSYLVRYYRTRMITYMYFVGEGRTCYHSRLCCFFSVTI